MFGMMAGGLIFSVVKQVERDEHIAMAPFIIVSYFLWGYFDGFYNFKMYCNYKRVVIHMKVKTEKIRSIFLN